VSDREWTVGPDEAGLRLDKFLAAAGRLGSRARAVDALDRGKIFLNQQEVAMDAAGSRLAAGDRVRMWIDRPGSATRRARADVFGDIKIVFEDDSLLVVDKPSGLLAVPLERRDNAPSVFEEIRSHFRSRRKPGPFVVHRIDRDTSGLVVFAKDAAAQQQLKNQFRRREPERIYWAIVYGHPTPANGTWRDHLVWDRKALIQKETDRRDPHASEAISDYKVLETFRDASLIEVSLRTGRRNQIRLQARLRGHTLVGERRYVFGPEALRKIQFERQALHARRLVFRHPVDGRRLEFEAAPPADFAALLARLRGR
jgi:23S rRNA pseudouridine1911/1915/1917 synthase